MRRGLICALLVSVTPGVVSAQSTTPPSLQVDPQQGATPPAPLQRIEPNDGPLTNRDLPQPLSLPAQDTPVQVLAPPPEIQYRQSEVTLQTTDEGLPTPEEAPFELDRSSDPILALAAPSTSLVEFREAVQAAIRQHPYLAEAEADRDEAEALRNEARMLEYPVIDFSLTHFQILDRQFSNDPQNVLERSRPRERTDALLRLGLPLVDFGRARARIASGNERLAAAEANLDTYAVELAESAIAAWYQVFTYRVLVRLSQAFLENQNELYEALQVRIEQGASARADLAQYDGYRAAASSQLAEFRRQLETAEAQYRAFIGNEPPKDLGRAPSADPLVNSRDMAVLSAASLPAVERARRLASVAEFDSRAARAAEAPSVSLAIDAGRYGVIENDRDFDIRASVTLSHRFLGGARQRSEQASARERRADAAYRRILIEAERDAEIAWADVRALSDATEALRENYFASRQSRDALFARFRYSRGTLNEVLNAQTNYFNVATRFLAAVSELDIARYRLLARTGSLLDALEVASAEQENP